MKRPLYQQLASRLQARINCKVTGNTEWFARHEDAIEYLVKNYMPSGSGIDCGTKFNEESSPERLVFDTSYHHMNDVGMYDGWTEHSVIVTPSLTSKINIRITGRDRKDIKEYLYDVYHAALCQEIND